MFKTSCVLPLTICSSFFSFQSPEPCILCPCASTKEAVKDKAKDGKKKVPKIFFGTRTHKQITQIAHELKRTVYSGVPMTILSSRNQTCVHPEVAPHSNRNERCRDLLEAKDVSINTCIHTNIHMTVSLLHRFLSVKCAPYYLANIKPHVYLICLCEKRNISNAGIGPPKKFRP